MSLRTAVVVVLAIVVVATLTIFFGAVRPSGGPPDAGRGSVESVLGWLRSRDTVTFEDLARSRPGCEDRATGTFAIPSGVACRIALPDAGSFTLCADENAPASSAAADGPEFPPGTFGPDDLACTEPAQVDLYEEDMVLTLSCAPFGVPCRFSVGEAEG
ncbi:hypothetical protein [Cellulomonas sp. ATA003]|uniref:hypothetical protein n=1 Tax=Cellulomonas sp. ATA003 TaxID=3073064 RepID=UPI002872D0FE|nr:hypothetical protein [Cellulomonas sp. ATA003]WNB87306.1 hypothetical protein REH70_09505 [Cellulomonas sp. ATA003]